MSDNVRRILRAVELGILTRREAVAKPDLTPEERAQLRFALRGE